MWGGTKLNEMMKDSIHGNEYRAKLRELAHEFLNEVDALEDFIYWGMCAVMATNKMAVPEGMRPDDKKRMDYINMTGSLVTTHHAEPQDGHTDFGRDLSAGAMSYIVPMREEGSLVQIWNQPMLRTGEGDNIIRREGLVETGGKQEPESNNGLFILEGLGTIFVFVE